MRAQIVLLSTEGKSAREIAAQLACQPNTIYRWRRRFQCDGVEGLLDRPRPGRPTKINAHIVEKVLRLTTQRIPKEATHWSTRLMAKYAGISQWQVRQIWAAAALKPHRLKTFKISKDPHFAEKVLDVVGLYMDPPTNAVVLSVDEKT